MVAIPCHSSMATLVTLGNISCYRNAIFVVLLILLILAFLSIVSSSSLPRPSSPCSLSLLPLVAKY